MLAHRPLKHSVITARREGRLKEVAANIEAEHGRDVRVIVAELGNRDGLARVVDAWLDATFEKVREGGRIVSQARVVAVACVFRRNPTPRNGMNPTPRFETRSLLITSNWAFEQWTNFLPGATTALDRFLHHAEVVALSRDSYRLREARSRRTDLPKEG